MMEPSHRLSGNFLLLLEAFLLSTASLQHNNTMLKVFLQNKTPIQHLGMSLFSLLPNVSHLVALEIIVLAKNSLPSASLTPT